MAIFIQVDRVIEPLETIYTELKKQDEYSIFFIYMILSVNILPIIH